MPIPSELFHPRWFIYGGSVPRRWSPRSFDHPGLNLPPADNSRLMYKYPGTLETTNAMAQFDELHERLPVHERDQLASNMAPVFEANRH